MSTETLVHEYLSTACFHGHHGYCRSMRGYQGQKRPAQCKFCDARCSCECHVPAAGVHESWCAARAVVSGPCNCHW